MQDLSMAEKIRQKGEKLTILDQKNEIKGVTTQASGR
jgi:hypothetical protein